MSAILEAAAMPEDLSKWLSDAGKRPGPAAPESSEALLRYLEEITGRPMRSREDIWLYFAELAADQVGEKRQARKRQTIWQSALLTALVLAFLQYHYVDVQLAIASLPSLVVFLPAV